MDADTFFKYCLCRLEFWGLSNLSQLWRVASEMPDSPCAVCICSLDKLI